MLYTIANLLVGGVADKKGALNCVFLDEDGSTFATDRMCLVIVEPSKTDDDEFRVAGVEPTDVRENGVAVPEKLVAQTLRAIPKQPMRQVHRHAALTRCDNVVELATTKDGVGATKASSTRIRTAQPNIQEFFKDAPGEKARVCISLKRLKKLVDTLDKMCGGDEAQPIYVTVGGEDEPMFLRTQSYMTGQRISGVLTALKVDEWLRLSKWERKLLDKGVKKLAKRKGKKQEVRRRHR